MIKIILLLVIFTFYSVNCHNSINFDAANSIPVLQYWTPAQIPTRISSYGARVDQFVRFLNFPVLSTATLRASIPVQGLSEPITVPIPTGVQFSVPTNLAPNDESNLRPITSQSAPTFSTQSQTQTVQHAVNNNPININMPAINPLDSAYITQFATPTKSTHPNHMSNTDTETKVLFNSPMDNNNFGQTLGPMFIEREKTPLNNNSPKFPINNNFNPKTVPVPRLYDIPTRGFNFMSNTQFSNSPDVTHPVGQPQQIPEGIGQPSSFPMREIYTNNKIPVMILPYN